MISVISFSTRDTLFSMYVASEDLSTAGLRTSINVTVSSLFSMYVALEDLLTAGLRTSMNVTVSSLFSMYVALEDLSTTGSRTLSMHFFVMIGGL
jgi:uncharacterized membrane protein YhiD involved in acid resistance